MDPTALDEGDLMVGFRVGREDALAHGYRRWSGPLYSTALRATGSPEDVADITQAVFVNAWRGSQGYRPEAGSPVGWLMTITRRRIADHWEAKTRTARARAAVEAADPVPTSVMPDVERIAAQMLVGWGSRPGPWVRLPLYDDLTHRQIAQRLGHAPRYGQEPPQAVTWSAPHADGGGP